MTMQQQFRKFAIPVAAAAVLALNGVAYASNTDATSPQQAPEKKVDCKKTPDDPKCIKK